VGVRDAMLFRIYNSKGPSRGSVIRFRVLPPPERDTVFIKLVILSPCGEESP